MKTGNTDMAMEYLERAKKLQPRAPAVRSAEVILLSRAGQAARALELGRVAIEENVIDYDLANATFVLAWRAGDFALASKAMQSRMTAWPESRAEGHVQLGNMYASSAKDPGKALDAFKQAISLATDSQRPALMEQIPPEYRARLTEPAPPQTSANKG
jgi:tetratricopeptide (TPR) repeat protein